MMHIAIVDDDETVQAFVAETLRGEGHLCSCYRSGLDLLAAAQRETFDLLIVDWNMPGMSGIHLVELAKSRIAACPPVIMLTNRSDKDDIALALNTGADDFIIKPESPVVILARVNALLRRSAVGGAAGQGPLQFGAYLFDTHHNVVKFGGEDIALTAKEFALAMLFFSNQNRPLSRAYIMEAVWKSVAELSTRTLDMHVSRIRTKLSLRLENGFSLRTVFGYGYRLETDHAQD